MNARIAAAGLIVALLATALPARAQQRDTEAKLAAIKRELVSVAAERRKLEGDRGEATRALRTADEQVGTTGRALRETQTRIGDTTRQLQALRARRAVLARDEAARRAELATLLRAAHRQPRHTALQTLLAQDRVADAQRLLAYQKAVQQQRTTRIAALSAQLRELDALEADIHARQRTLDAARGQQQAQLGALERDRASRAQLVARIEGDVRDRASRERTLGKDAKGLEQVLRNLRAAAARAEAERRRAARVAAAAEAKAAAAARRSSARGGAARSATARSATARASAPRPPVASAAPVQVGGLGWPLSGTQLAGYGAAMPDGRRSEGLLIAAAAGTPVKAIADGTVVYSEWMTGYGLLLIVDHGGGLLSLYAHNDALLTDTGAAVKRGDAIGTVGSSGGHGRPALYFELRRNGAPVNPSSILRR